MTDPLLVNPAAAASPDPDRELATSIASLTPAQQHQLLSVIQSGDSGLPPETQQMLVKALQPTAAPAGPGGPLERLMTPLGQALEGIAGLPEHAVNAFTQPVATAEAMFVDPAMAQARKAGAAAGEGRLVEAVGHGAAAALPIVGPIAAGIGETLGEGNVAGAVGQSLVAGAPFAKTAMRPTAIADMMRRRAAARILDVMRPRQGAVAAAEGVADEVLSGVPGSRHDPAGLGFGSLSTLAARARERAKMAGEDVGDLRALDTPVDPSGVSRGLRAEADQLTTTPPPRSMFEEVRSPIVDEFGDPIVGVVERTVAGRPMTGNPALVKALESEANFIDELAAQFPNDKAPVAEGMVRLYRGESSKRRTIPGRVTKPGSWFSDDPADADLYANQFPGHPGRKMFVDVPEDVARAAKDAPGEYVLPDEWTSQAKESGVPAGELFKQRAAIGRRTGRAYETMPGAEAAASVAAGKSAREGLTGLLHREIPASRIPDREYHVFRTAWTNLERHRRSKLTNRGLKGLKDLLAGRAVGALLGAGVGGLGFGPFGGVAGAFVGTVLGESAYWGSLRAATYSQLAKALNSGDLDTAAQVFQSTALTYAASKAELNRQAQKELKAQAEGVVEP